MQLGVTPMPSQIDDRLTKALGDLTTPGFASAVMNGIPSPRSPAHLTWGICLAMTSTCSPNRTTTTGKR